MCIRDRCRGEGSGGLEGGAAGRAIRRAFATGDCFGGTASGGGGLSLCQDAGCQEFSCSDAFVEKGAQALGASRGSSKHSRHLDSSQLFNRSQLQLARAHRGRQHSSSNHSSSSEGAGGGGGAAGGVHLADCGVPWVLWVEYNEDHTAACDNPLAAKQGHTCTSIRSTRSSRVAEVSPVAPAENPTVAEVFVVIRLVLRVHTVMRVPQALALSIAHASIWLSPRSAAAAKMHTPDTPKHTHTHLQDHDHRLASIQTHRHSLLWQQHWHSHTLMQADTGTDTGDGTFTGSTASSACNTSELQEPLRH
eukprot:14243218-Alexandrium_andersonii.AAC.1